MPTAVYQKMVCEQSVHPTRQDSGRRRRKRLNGGSRNKPACDTLCGPLKYATERLPDIEAPGQTNLRHLDKVSKRQRRNMKYVGEVVRSVPVTNEVARCARSLSRDRQQKQPPRLDHRHHPHKGHSAKRKAHTVWRGEEEKQEDLGRNSSWLANKTGIQTGTSPAVAQSSEVSWPFETLLSTRTDLEASQHRRTVLPRPRSESVVIPSSGEFNRCRKLEEDTIFGPKRRTTSQKERSRSVLRDVAESSRPKRDHTSNSQVVRSSGTAKPKGGTAKRPQLGGSRTVTESQRGSIERPPPRRNVTSSNSTTAAPRPRKVAPLDSKRTTSSIFSRFLPPATTIPEKQISCLTCGGDNIPISKSAKLACTHRMCHDCLRRIFTMSVTDPAHMPPRCCTSEHIPLKHVDKLFDMKFKKTWNHKFQEYTTRNKIYCPARGCGEWIKPDHITTDSNGRKVGKCKRCSTRVCCICNNRMHLSRDCPKDPATKEFIEVAKEKGWQKCYNCSAMVELKEGCNHMTCRCTAEFCMVCGLKWKSCDCPWFNYENIDAQLGNPVRYQEELDRRRIQEQRDEDLARRMEILGLGALHVNTSNDDEGAFFGVGNAAPHHMNVDFQVRFLQRARDVLTAPYLQAQQAADDLLSGTVTGRENPLPGMPLPRDQTANLLRGPSQTVQQLGIAVGLGSDDINTVPLPVRLPRRHSATRQRQKHGQGRGGEVGGRAVFTDVQQRLAEYN